MIIGFTYDLKEDYLAEGFSEEAAAEFDAPETIEGISNALHGLGHEVVRIGNVRSLLKRLHQGERWDLVFNICEGVRGIGREAQVPAILEIFDIPYVFSDPLVLSLTLHKGMTKRIIRDLGIPTAPFAIVERPEDLDGIDLPYPLFVKPVAEGTGKGIGPDSKVGNYTELKKICIDRLERFSQPVLVETFLPGREITVGIIGNGAKARVIGMMEVIYNQRETSGIYSYHNKAHYEDFIDYTVPEKELYERCSEIALASWRGLKCQDAGRVDLRLDQHGVPNFMEVNPLAGLNPLHSDLPILASKSGMDFNELIEKIIEAAFNRMK